jgi:redox-sensitive bicupin YhaK (pirin superfamily)
MMTLRPSAERGHANFGWLDSYHSFSFGQYHDPAHMGFSDLRVINQDVVAPGAGFGRHGHKDMEIITYVLSGAVAHEDSMGNRETVRAGEIQRMTAGTGVEHSEFNASTAAPVEFLQIWVLPDQRGLKPGYEQISLDDRITPGQWTLIGAREGDEHVITIHQDVKLHAGRFAAGTTAALPVTAARAGWLQLIEGTVRVGDHTLQPGDGLALRDLDAPAMTALTDAHALFFDLRQR